MMRAMQRRLRIAHRELQFVTRRHCSEMNGRPGARDRHRAGGDRIGRQIRVAKLDRYAAHWHAKGIGRELGQDRVRACPQIMRRRPYDNAPVGIDARLGRRGQATRRIRRRCHPQSNELIAIPHRPRHRIATGPTKALGAQRVTFTE